MSPIELFVTLVGLAFVGSLSASRSETGAWGLLSGSEYILLGVIMGPHLLGLATRTAFQGFESLLLMALAWLLAVRGTAFAAIRGEAARVVDILLSAFGSLTSLAAALGAAYLSARHLGLADGALLAFALAVVTSESAPFSFNGQASADRPVLSALERATCATELPPVLALGAMMLIAQVNPPSALPEATWLLVSSLSGVLLGAIVVALIGAHYDKGELWPLLLGAVLLVTGTTIRLNLPALTPTFLLGVTVATFSQHRHEIRAQMGSTQRQLLVPCLLLAGVVLDLPSTWQEWVMIASALGARFLIKLTQGLLIGRRHGLPWRAAASLSAPLLRTSGLSMLLGLSIFLRHMSEVESLARMALTTAFLSALLGELLSISVASPQTTAAQAPPLGAPQ